MAVVSSCREPIFLATWKSNLPEKSNSNGETPTQRQEMVVFSNKLGQYRGTNTLKDIKTESTAVWCAVQPQRTNGVLTGWFQKIETSFQRGNFKTVKLLTVSLIRKIGGSI